MGAMLIDNGGLELGVTGQVEGHIQSKQLFKLKKSGLLACNPSTGRGFCQNDACQAAYKKEGLIWRSILKVLSQYGKIFIQKKNMKLCAGFGG